MQDAFEYSEIPNFWNRRFYRNFLISQTNLRFLLRFEMWDFAVVKKFLAYVKYMYSFLQSVLAVKPRYNEATKDWKCVLYCGGFVICRGPVLYRELRYDGIHYIAVLLYIQNWKTHRSP